MQDMCNIEVTEKAGPTVLSSVNNRLAQQLIIDIPKDPSAPIHDTYPYYMPPYPAPQNTGLLMNRNSVYPMLQTKKELQSPINVSPPQMYIVQGTISDQDSHRSYEYDATDINSEGSSNGYEINSQWSSNGSEINNQRSPESERELDSPDSADSLTNKDIMPIKILSSSSRKCPSTNNGKQKRNRTNYTNRQIQELERMFLGNQYPDHATLELLCRDLGIPETRLKIWFQNKRAKSRRQGKEKPQTTMPQTTMPQSTMPQTTMPQTTMPQAIMPQTMMSQTTMPFMGPNEMLPPYHPMLYGSPAHFIQHPLFQPSHPMGMDRTILENPPIRNENDLHLTISQQGDLPSSQTLSTSKQPTLLSASLQNLETSEKAEKKFTPPLQQFSYPFGLCPPYYGY